MQKHLLSPGSKEICLVPNYLRVYCRKKSALMNVCNTEQGFDGISFTANCRMFMAHISTYSFEQCIETNAIICRRKEKVLWASYNPINLQI